PGALRAQSRKRTGMLSASAGSLFIVVPVGLLMSSRRMPAEGRTAVPVTYQPWLVLLSFVMAIQGAYVGLGLAVQVGDASGMLRRLLLAGAAFSLAVAIWTMHFVGMLAVRLPFPIDYLVFPTLLSFLVCVIVVGAAVYATSSGPLTPMRLVLSAGLMGA